MKPVLQKQGDDDDDNDGQIKSMEQSTDRYIAHSLRVPFRSPVAVQIYSMQ